MFGLNGQTFAQVSLNRSSGGEKTIALQMAAKSIIACCLISRLNLRLFASSHLAKRGVNREGIANNQVVGSTRIEASAEPLIRAKGNCTQQIAALIGNFSLVVVEALADNHSCKLNVSMFRSGQPMAVGK